MRRLRAVRRAAGLALAGLALWTSALTVRAADPEPTSPEVVPIPMSDFARQTERVTTDLRRLRNLAASPPNVAAARKNLQRVEAAMREVEINLPQVSLDQVSRTELESANTQWRRIDAKLERVDEDFDAHARAVEAGIERLARTQRVWARTRELAAPEATPQAVLERLELVSVEIDSVHERLAEQLSSVLVTLDRVTSHRLETTAAIERIGAAQDRIRQRLFFKSAPPLWRAFVSVDASPGLNERFRTAWRIHLQGLGGFLEDSRDLLILHVVGTLLLGILLARLGRQAASWAEQDPDLIDAANLLSHPAIAAIVVALSTVIILYPQADHLVWEIAYVAAALPLLVLVRAVLEPHARRPIYGLVGLFVLAHLFNLMPADPLLQRLLHLGAAAVALAGTLRLLAVERTRTTVDPDPWWRATIVVGRLAAVLWAVSIVANVFGFMSLALMTTRGTINSAYLIVAMRATELVLEGAIATGLRTRTARALRMVRDFPKLLRRRLAGLLRIVLALVWVLVTLLVFDILAPALEWGRGVLGDRWSIGSLELSLGSIVSFVFTIWLSIQLSRFVRFVLEEDVFPRVSLARGLPGTISMLVRYAILAIGFLVAVAAAGIELSSFAIMAGALGVGIGFGLQSVVNNFVSGLILAFERPIQVGDTIEVGPLLGEVKSIGIRASTIRTYEGAEVIVPNGDLVSAQVTNWTLSDRRRRLLVPVGVAYGTDPGKVIDLLEQVASDHVDVIDHPPPTALFLGFGDSSLDFDLRFWTVKFERWREVKSEVTVAVNNALKQAGIEIPFPQRDLHVRSVDPGAARRLSGEPAEERAAGPTES